MAPQLNESVEALLDCLYQTRLTLNEPGTICTGALAAEI